MKTVAILQSNYIPWKGYFDLIAAVDEFILYDDMQFTKNDWRNRNKVKTPKGIEWVSIPVGQNISRRIRDVKLDNNRWQEKHWKTIESNYRRAQHFEEISQWLKPLYLNSNFIDLSTMNRQFIEAICRYLNIKTIIRNSWDYTITDGKSERVANLCAQAGGTEYISGPSAKDYLDENVFIKKNIKITWFDYSGYPTYPQLWGDFIHEVSIIDLLFNCGKESNRFMKYVK
ncbi:MAG: WbqC family protein [Deltaproteobacteria bacterium]|nr:WbqC family protein [Deltaproteobacteria bacterium]